MDLLNKNVRDNIRKNVKKLVDKGSTSTHAISVIASQNGTTADALSHIVSPKKQKKEHGVKDVKTSVGSHVTLKGDTKEDRDIYEVIDVNNKEEIIIMDIKTYKTIKVKEEEIEPIITESVMKKNLNEANYNLSIDGLETIDADKLSQILSLAGEAESSSDVETPTDIDTTPDVENDDSIVGAEVSIEDTTVSTDVSEPEYDYEDYSQYLEGEPIDEDVLLDPQSSDETYNAKHDEKIIDDLLSEEDFDEIPEAEELTPEAPIMEDDMGMDMDASDIDLDSEIAECLRLAGVELNEVSEEKASKGKKDLPQVVGHKTAFSKAKQDEFAPGENQRPNYKCVRTKDVMGKESSEGFKQSLNVAKVCCNESKIKSICETATRMYAKKDHSEWLALDRRYVEKLINEGVGYENASKMLLKAKQGK